MQNFFDYQGLQIEKGIDCFRQTVFLKIGANKYCRSNLELKNTTITLTDQLKSENVLNFINIANAYIEFNIHVCMGRGVLVQESNKEIQLYGLNSQIIQILKLYCVQKNFADQYKVIKQIGQGSYGKVYKVLNVIDGIYYAMKMFDKQLLLDPRDKSAILKEIQILRLMNHPNVIQMKECFESDQCLFLVLELLEGKLEIQEKNKLKEDQAVKILMSLLKGLEFIHSKQIIHRDIKPDNILLRNTGEPVITDFGLADFYNPAGHYLFSKCGTRNYVAPEMMLSQVYDYKVDIYSLGVVFHQLITGKVPNPWENLKISDDLLTLFIGMLNSNPKIRFSINEIKQNKYIRRIQRRSQLFNAMGSLTEAPKDLLLNNENSTKAFSLHSTDI